MHDDILEQEAREQLEAQGLDEFSIEATALDRRGLSVKPFGASREAAWEHSDYVEYDLTDVPAPNSHSCARATNPCARVRASSVGRLRGAR